MDNKGFYIKTILATGTKVQDSRVDFNKGCNLIHGQSDTGKSVVFRLFNIYWDKKILPKKQLKERNMIHFICKYVCF